MPPRTYRHGHFILRGSGIGVKDFPLDSSPKKRRRITFAADSGPAAVKA
jgi:hypothetical protein